MLSQTFYPIAFLSYFNGPCPVEYAIRFVCLGATGVPAFVPLFSLARYKHTNSHELSDSALDCGEIYIYTHSHSLPLVTFRIFYFPDGKLGRRTRNITFYNESESFRSWFKRTQYQHAVHSIMCPKKHMWGVAFDVDLIWISLALRPFFFRRPGPLSIPQRSPGPNGEATALDLESSRSDTLVHAARKWDRFEIRYIWETPRDY